MDVRAIETFVAVAEELHFGAAARRLHVVQSTASAAVQSLERELGVPLLVRSSRHVELTEAGRAALVEARAALAAIDRMRVAADPSGAGLRGTVRFGTFAALPILDLPAVLAAYAERHPGVDVRLTTSPSGSSGLAADLRIGRLDVAVVALPPDLLGGLVLHPIAVFPFTVLLPTGHPLADRSSLSPEDLADADFVDSPPGFGNRVVVDRAFAAAGLHRTVRTEVAELPSIGAFVAAGMGIAVGPTALVTPVEALVEVSFAPAIDWQVSLATAPDPSLAVSAFVALVAGGTIAPASSPVPIQDRHAYSGPAGHRKS